MAKSTKQLIDKVCGTCNKEFQVPYHSRDRLYCSKTCSNNNPDLIKQRNERTKQSQLIKYGGHPMTTDDTKSKLKKSLLDKYGVEHALQNKDFFNKNKDTKLIKYGNENYCNIDKIKDTKINKYGSLYTPGDGGVTLKAINRLNHIFFTSDKFTPLFDKIKSGDDISKYFYFKCSNCLKIFKFKRSKSREPLCRCSYKNMYTKNSKVEIEIIEFLNENNIVNIIKHDRKILSGFEIDIYLPDYNLAIEVNGVFWHSEKSGKQRDYHINKTLDCKNKNIRLLHITDLEWYNKKDIIKSILLSKLNITSDIKYARNFIIKRVDSNSKDIFLDKNHLQGRDISKIKLGLFDKKTNELYSVVTFGKPRFNKNYEYELIRFCNKLNSTVVGGFNKLLKYFIKTYKPNTIITYSNADLNTGDVYSKNGFTSLGLTPPNYFYFKNNLIVSRYEAQKDKLSKLLSSDYNQSLNEYDNMSNAGYSRYWNCGNYKFEYVDK